MRPSRQQALASTGIFHKTWRGHNREHVLAETISKRRYLSALCATKAAATEGRVAWHSYCLMNNHAHETGHALCASEDLQRAVRNLGNWMRNAHSRFGQWFNRANNRQGKVAYDRPKTREVEGTEDLLTVMAYGDANPVKAGLVKHPRHWRWSSYRFYADGLRDEVSEHLDLPQAYLDLGATPQARQCAYRSLVDDYLRKQGLIDDQVAHGADVVAEPQEVAAAAQEERERPERNVGIDGAKPRPPPAGRSASPGPHAS